MGNDADGQDALQDALISLARGIRRFDGRSTFGTWSYRVATNACLDELRRRSRRPTPHAFEEEPTTADPGPLPDHVVERLEIDEALTRLPEEFRAAVVLRDLCDLEYSDIAQLLDVPAGTVRSRIARGRAQLARHLGNHHPTPERPTPQP